MLTNIDRVEVLKGPASVLYGSGQPGGLINLVTKKPLPMFRNQFSYTYGHFHQHRGQIDSTGPINRERTLLYRFNGAYFNNDSFRWSRSTTDVRIRRCTASVAPPPPMATHASMRYMRATRWT